MPEGPELDIDKLHEEIHGEVEREGGVLLKVIALTTSLFAALAAVAAWLAGDTDKGRSSSNASARFSSVTGGYAVSEIAKFSRILVTGDDAVEARSGHSVGTVTALRGR